MKIFPTMRLALHDHARYRGNRVAENERKNGVFPETIDSVHMTLLFIFDEIDEKSTWARISFSMEAVDSPPLA
jgi:hypothetical protein